ncbi:FABP family protein [Spongiactinospora sp. TRM90649]|uniref:FABP family protein n=1 Tax=Spongiactinospora sp. TRM90649 TaxID=3031114 RepID=UPI0023F7C17D|nr:FABP family protein [Spongiactinospora sp. TRM90649]MDF5751770.1 FABP family protein [Spongiactinospora sp. TRM90649]
MGVPEMHADIEPIAFLLGRWEGAGVGGYPTMESIQFGQEVVFGHNGKPFLTYESRTWLLNEEGERVRPTAIETGFWRALPERQLEVVLSHPTGIVEIYLGEVVFNKIELATDVVARTSTAKEYAAGRRMYGLVNGNLMWVYEMAALGKPMQPHMSAELKKVADFAGDDA